MKKFVPDSAQECRDTYHTENYCYCHQDDNSDDDRYDDYGAPPPRGRTNAHARAHDNALLCYFFN